MKLLSSAGICKYYDNRQAVVTVTADDWADYCNEKFVQACQNFVVIIYGIPLQ